MKTNMNIELEIIKEKKVEEARDFFEKIGIEEKNLEPLFMSKETVEYSEDSNFKNQDTKFHWTRLSINSNIGCIIE